MPQLKLDLEQSLLSLPSAATSTSTLGRPSSSKESNAVYTNSAEAIGHNPWPIAYGIGQASLFHGNCIDWLAEQPSNSIHGVVTDPPYGLVEYQPEQQRKLRTECGGVWRVPPAFDGRQRSPVPRFTTLTASDLDSLDCFLIHGLML